MAPGYEVATMVTLRAEFGMEGAGFTDEQLSALWIAFSAESSASWLSCDGMWIPLFRAWMARCVLEEMANQ